MPASTPKLRRRWYQFSLRALLVVMMLLSVTVGWVGWRMQRARANRYRMEAANRTIAWLGGCGCLHDMKIKTLRPQTWLEELFDDPGREDDPTRVIQVSRLTLLGTAVNDAGLKHVIGLTSLEELYFWGCPKVTDAGLEHLKGLTHLRELDLTQTQVTEDGVNELRRALPNCKMTVDENWGFKVFLEKDYPQVVPIVFDVDLLEPTGPSPRSPPAPPRAAVPTARPPAPYR